MSTFKNHNDCINSFWLRSNYICLLSINCRLLLLMNNILLLQMMLLLRQLLLCFLLLKQTFNLPPKIIPQFYCNIYFCVVENSVNNCFIYCCFLYFCEYLMIFYCYKMSLGRKKLCNNKVLYFEKGFFISINYKTIIWIRKYLLKQKIC